MSKKKLEKEALNALIASHRQRYGAGLGKRKCRWCGEVGEEQQFRGLRCRDCTLARQKQYHIARMKARGYGLLKRGRKPKKGSKKVVPVKRVK